MKKLLPLITLLFLCSELQAGTFYRYRISSDGPLALDIESQVWIEGDRRRVELLLEDGSPRSYDLAISRDGGSIWTRVNRQNGTFFRSDEEGRGASGPGNNSTLFQLPVGPKQSSDRFVVEELPPVPGDEIAGRTTTRHELRFSYRLRATLGGTPLAGRVECTIIRWTTPDLPSPREIPLTTRVLEIDRRIAAWRLATGPELREDVTITRTIDGGPAIREQRSFLVLEIDERDLEPSLFEIPSGLEHRLPVIGGPGL
ncbi:MAG TPA: hypothetical protein VF701_02085 [Thermoanaerobaculia bacterium]